ncbi:unnamed protein product, partial [Didymodactylos carnosus]
LVQHDQIKGELVKQGGIPLLIRCITETKFDVVKVQQRALEILWAMTFNEQAADELKHDEKFMTQVKILLSSNEKGVQKAAEGIIWKLEKEAEFMVKQEQGDKISELNSATSIAATAKAEALGNSPAYKYDIMISYSHSDKDLCYQIQERLVKEKYGVWLDRDNLYGSTMEAMADAIENAEFVLLCMSDTYKQSAYCRSEAHYAFERRCQIIPLIMKEKYKPDGWLGFIVSGRLYIDFSKMTFDSAYERLKSEILQHRSRSINGPPNKQDRIKGHNFPPENKTEQQQK